MLSCKEHEFVEYILKWIKNNLNPQDVFSGENLFHWIRMNRYPEDVFNYAQLSRWAETNGYEKKEK